MNVRDLLEATTFVYRKTPAVVEKTAGAVRVTEVWVDTPEISGDNAPSPDTHDLVDVHFFVVAINRQAAKDARDDFVALMDELGLPEGSAGAITYIALGGLVGDQGAAMQLMALGQVLGAWEVLTPERILPGIDPERASEIAGNGGVLTTGYNRAAVA